MTKLQWWPSFLMDESIPPGKASPDDYIRHPVDDGWMIAGDREEGMDEDVTELSEVVKPGGILKFSSCVRLGSVRAEIQHNEGKGALVLLEEIPESCNTLSWGFEVIACDLEEFAEAFFEEEEWADGDEIDIDCHDWTENVPFRLAVSTDGDPKPRFERVTTVEGTGTA